MKKVLRALILVILVIGFVFGIATIVKYFKLNNIYKKIDKNTNYNSFYLKTKITDTNQEESITEAFYREGKGKLIASNGLYTWTDGEKAYLVDEENETIYTLNIEENFALVSYNMFTSPVQGYNKNIIDKLLLAGDANTTIKKEKIGNNDCYCIKTKENLAIKKVWIEKYTGKISKAEIEFSNGDIFKYEYELNFNTLKNSNLSLPDITGYTLINGETGNVLTESFNLE